jgi:RNase H-like domain found in reverse transcriptase
MKNTYKSWTRSWRGCTEITSRLIWKNVYSGTRRCHTWGSLLLQNFFRTHIKDFALIATPLFKLTRKDSGYKSGPLPEKALKAFYILQKQLTSERVMAFTKSDRQYAIITNAATGTANTPGGLRAILTQVDQDGNVHAISFSSRQLKDHEMNYSPFLLEAAAAVWGMDFFNKYLKGKRFILYTDHKPLEKLGHLHSKMLNRLQKALPCYTV